MSEDEEAVLGSCNGDIQSLQTCQKSRQQKEKKKEKGTSFYRMTESTSVGEAQAGLLRFSRAPSASLESLRFLPLFPAQGALPRRNSH